MIVGPPLDKVTPPLAARLGATKFVPPVDGHDHRLPVTLQLMVIVSLLGLLAGGGILVAYIHDTNERIAQLEQYVAGRGEYRDAEAKRQEEAFRRGICDVLAGLPARGALEELRDKYRCPSDRSDQP